MRYTNSTVTLAELYTQEYIKSVLESRTMGLGIMPNWLVKEVGQIPLSTISQSFPYIGSRLSLFPTLLEDLAKLL